MTRKKAFILMPQVRKQSCHCYGDENFGGSKSVQYLEIPDLIPIKLICSLSGIEKMSITNWFASIQSMTRIQIGQDIFVAVTN